MSDTIPMLIVIENEIDADGWSLIAPYGEHAKTRQVRANGRIVTQRLIQCLDPASADLLIDNENSLFRKLKRAVVGIPVYKLCPPYLESRQSQGGVLRRGEFIALCGRGGCDVRCYRCNKKAKL
jgi:hypothetical protein